MRGCTCVRARDVCLLSSALTRLRPRRRLRASAAAWRSARASAAAAARAMAPQPSRARRPEPTPLSVAEAAALSGAARERAAAVCSLLLQLLAWAVAPQSPEECRLALVGSLQRLRPKAAGRGDGARFEAIVQRTQQLMSIVSGTGMYRPDSK